MSSDTHEIEIKARISNLEPLEKSLTQLGCSFSKPVIQKDTIYIPKGIAFENLIPGTSVLRIRELNDKVFFTLKQRKPQAEELIKIEKEIVVSDAKTMASIIELLGYSPAVQVNKKRRTCTYQSYEICLDKIDQLGSFIEIECISHEDPEKIQKDMLDFLLSLGISESAIERKGYDTLMYEFGRIKS